MYLRALLQKPPGKAPDGGHRAQVYLPKQKAGILSGCLDLSQGSLSTLSAAASKDHPGPTAGQLLGHNLSDTWRARGGGGAASEQASLGSD